MYRYGETVETEIWQFAGGRHTGGKPDMPCD